VPQPDAGQRKARPGPHASNRNGHCVSVQTGRNAGAASGTPSRSRASPTTSPAAKTNTTLSSRRDRTPSLHQLDPVVLDHRVGEQTIRGVLQGGLGGGAILPVDLDVEDL